MKNSWVIIWIATFCKAEGVEPGVYLNKQVAQRDADKRNMQDNSARFHVVEYEGVEHKHALQHRENIFR
jgi:hypothetical protein